MTERKKCRTCGKPVGHFEGKWWHAKTIEFGDVLLGNNTCYYIGDTPHWCNDPEPGEELGGTNILPISTNSVDVGSRKPVELPGVSTKVHEEGEAI